jgi:hypothetical protein
LSPEDRIMIEDAIEADLDAESLHSAHDEARLTRLEDQMNALSEAVVVIAEPAVANEDRLAQVEKQTHGLAEAIIAMTETSDTLAPAIKAVKDEMTDATPVPLPRHLTSF